MRDIVSSIQAEQDLVIRAPAASVTEVTGGPGTGKTAVALHRAAYLLYQDRRRYAGGILCVSPTPLLVAYTEGVLPSLGEEGQVAIRAVGSLVDGVTADLYDDPDDGPDQGLAADAEGAARARPRLPGRRRTAPPELRVVAFGAPCCELDGRRAGARAAQALGRHRPGQPAAPAGPPAAAGRAVAQDRAAASTTGAGREERRAGVFDEDISDRASEFLDFLDAWWPVLEPRGVLAALRRREAARPAGPAGC